MKYMYIYYSKGIDVLGYSGTLFIVGGFKLNLIIVILELQLLQVMKLTGQI